MRLFAILNWFELACAYAFTILLSVIAFAFPVGSICESFDDQLDGGFDVQKCKTWYNSVAATLVIGFSISLLIKTHYCLAVWSYYLKLVKEEQYSGTPYAYTVITSLPPPIYAAEGDFKADVKIQEDVKQ